MSNEELIEQEQLDFQDCEDAEEMDEAMQEPSTPQVEEFEQEGANDESELALLRAECERMREELRTREAQDRAKARMDEELSSFAQYFPEVRASEIPTEVWDSVKNGNSLSGAYALYLRRADLERKRIADFNEKNRKMSSGTIIAGQDEKYFSPSEVKKMTPAQVKANYDDIIRSLRHWN